MIKYVLVSANFSYPRFSVNFYILSVLNNYNGAPIKKKKENNMYIPT